MELGFLDYITICDHYKNYNYENAITGFVANRISIFCHDIYFKKLKTDKNKFFEENKNYGCSFFKDPHEACHIKKEDPLFEVWLSFFYGYTKLELIEKYQDLLEFALQEPFYYFRTKISSNVYPLNFDV